MLDRMLYEILVLILNGQLEGSVSRYSAQDGTEGSNS